MTTAATNTAPASPQFEKFVRLLKELFMFDQADLDFGIYRIMNAKRDEITRFLEKDLLPQVRQTLGELESGDRKQVEDELAKAEAAARAAGFEPDQSPKVQELRTKLDAAGGGLDATEAEVYSDLYNFFRRYYHEGDFISQRRYKEGVYAIPYEGEEVKLYWANHDQYYIKSSENFRNYSFKVKLQLPGDDEPQERRVTFKLVDADTERDNNRAAAGKERRFLLADEDPLVEQDDELFVRFEYRPPGDKAKQDSLNAAAVERILNYKPEPAEDVDSKAAGLAEVNPFAAWQTALMVKAPTESNPDRTLLARHLAEYTARNTFDYFIHKDLGGFLRRELDFYIKNEIVHLDDIEHETAPRVEQYLAKVKAIRRIAHKIIDLVAQIEDFQKRLWLKKKFVVSTDYLATIDLLPKQLLREVAECKAQQEDWISTVAVDEIEGSLVDESYSSPPSESFLLANPHLSVDTTFFGRDFADTVAASIASYDDKLSGLLVHADSNHALCLLDRRYRNGVDAFYNDPPYNTDASEILYKNGYRTSSWCSLIDGLIEGWHALLHENGILCVTIDDEQVTELTHLLCQRFAKENHLGTVAVRSNPSGRITLRGVAQCHEYALFFSKSTAGKLGRLPRSQEQEARFDQEDEVGRFEWRNFRRDGSSSTRADRPKQFFPMVINGDDVRVPEVKWVNSRGEYELQEKLGKGDEIIWPIDSSGDERCWRWGIDTTREKLNEIVTRQNNRGEQQLYNKYRPNTAGILPLTIWSDAKHSSTEYGTALVKDLFGERSPFDFPKSLPATVDAIRIATPGNTGVVIDCFGGSGTTAHAVLDLNRQEQEQRKYVLIEMGKHFDTILLPRIKKAVYSTSWRRGKPQNRDSGCSHVAKLIRLESYEDALNNLEVRRTSEQHALLESQPGFREDYILRYMLDVETAGSPSLLNVQRFTDPFAYQMEIGTGSAGETKLVNVDLVETFNWLLGLRVRHIDTIRGVRIVEGENPDGEKVLVLWRRLAELDNDALDDWFEKQGYNTRDQEYDLVYVNCDNNLENLRRPDQTWKVRLIEEDFHRLMFDVDDV